jgi:hypothetical protein
MILQKVTFTEKNKNAETVDDFYYRNMEDKLNGRKGTGVRNLAADFMREGKILERFLVLKDDGCVLEIYTIFKTMDDLNEFTFHPISVKARDFWSEKNWTRSIEVFPINDFLNVKNKLVDLKSVI